MLPIQYWKCTRLCDIIFFMGVAWVKHATNTNAMLQGYGEKGIGEIPGGATLELDVELLSVKTSPFGSRVKIVEG